MCLDTDLKLPVVTGIDEKSFWFIWDHKSGSWTFDWDCNKQLERNNCWCNCSLSIAWTQQEQGSGPNWYSRIPYLRKTSWLRLDFDYTEFGSFANSSLWLQCLDRFPFSSAPKKCCCQCGSHTIVCFVFCAVFQTYIPFLKKVDKIAFFHEVSVIPSGWKRDFIKINILDFLNVYILTIFQKWIWKRWIS